MPAPTSSHQPALRPVYRTSEIRALEARFAAEGLMERAGAAAAEVASAMLAARSGPVVILAGPGNNGGDGFVAGRLLRAGFHEVIVVFAGDPARLPGDAASAHAALLAAGGSTQSTLPTSRPALVIDALFGLGFDRTLPAPYAAFVRWANEQSAPTLALDIPTGLRADTGIATAPAIRAAATLTFLGLKPGLLTAEGPDLCGEISVHTLGIDASAHDAAEGRLLEWPALAAHLPEAYSRRLNAVHKGTFGTVGVIGGRSGMIGAALLAGRAALRCGAGKVRVGFVAKDLPSVDPFAPELMLSDARQVLDADADVWVVGCGMGTEDAAKEALRDVIAAKSAVLLDADALNLLATDGKLKRSVRSRDASTIVTPHPAEAARLLDTTVAAVQRDRLAAAQSIAHELHAHVVLKGTGTVIAHPDKQFDINGSGNPGLAFAGSGDGLAGMLGACLAQDRDAATATRIGVCLHGAAADALVDRGIGPIGISGAELIDAARDLLNRARVHAGADATTR